MTRIYAEKVRNVFKVILENYTKLSKGASSDYYVYNTNVLIQVASVISENTK